MRELVEPRVGTTRGPDAFVLALEAGVATYVRPGSPLHKVIGSGSVLAGLLEGLGSRKGRELDADGLAARREPTSKRRTWHQRCRSAATPLPVLALPPLEALDREPPMTEKTTVTRSRRPSSAGRSRRAGDRTGRA